MIPRFVRALGLAAVVLLGSGTFAGAQTLETVRVASPPVDVAGNLFYALDLGYFKKAGIDVQITQLTAGAPVVDAVLGGAVDMGSANLLPIANAHLKGLDVVLVAPSGANSATSPIDGVIVGTKSPLKTAKDLEGKTLATSALQNILQIQALAWMDKNGANWKSVKWVEFPPAAEGAAVEKGTVVAAAITEPFLSAALAGGNVRLLTYTGSEVAPLVVEGGIFTSQEYVFAHTALIRKFSKAILDAGQWANGHPAEAAAILAKYSKRPPAAGAHHAVFPVNFHASDLQPLIDAAAKYGAIPASFPAGDITIHTLH